MTTPRPLALVVLLATLGPAPQHAAGFRQRQPIPGSDVELLLAFIPKGDFELGSASQEEGRDADEGPAVRVTLSPYWMTVHEITEEAFALFRFRRLDSPVGHRRGVVFDADAVSRPSPPYEDPAHGLGGGDKPATGMTRRSALHYARWLSEKTGRLFRLPTEAEWEHACEAGLGGEAVVGGSDGGLGERSAALQEVAWYTANSGGRLHPVGLRQPNGWGIHDLRGNAAEWVLDSYEHDLYARLRPAAPVADPVGGDPPAGRGLVRGGAYGDQPDALRCADRQPESAAWKRRDPQMPKSRWWNTDSPHVGFRLVSPVGERSLEQIREYWAGILGS